ncbi:MAG: hypothetical protein KDB27_17380 [Planctomycetales bacterium]|nr:hypothetical protein [Planctomycetales bacterium]
MFEKFELGGPHRNLQCDVKPKSRSLTDVLYGKQNFAVTVLFVGETYWGEPLKTHFDVRVVRDRVITEVVPQRVENLNVPIL